MKSESDRRRIQRVRFDSPLNAKLAASRVTLIDVSATGARIEHDFPLSRGRKVPLEFEFEGAVLTMECTVVRCKLENSDHGASYRTGLAFDPRDPSLMLVREMIANVVQRDFSARKAHIKRPRVK